MDSELLLKFTEYFPDYLSALSRVLFRFFGQPLIEAAAYSIAKTLSPKRALTINNEAQRLDGYN